MARTYRNPPGVRLPTPIAVPPGHRVVRTYRNPPGGRRKGQEMTRRRTVALMARSSASAASGMGESVSVTT